MATRLRHKKEGKMCYLFLFLNSTAAPLETNTATMDAIVMMVMFNVECLFSVEGSADGEAEGSNGGETEAEGSGVDEVDGEAEGVAIGEGSFSMYPPTASAAQSKISPESACIKIDIA